MDRAGLLPGDDARIEATPLSFEALYDLNGWVRSTIGGHRLGKVIISTHITVDGSSVRTESPWLPLALLLVAAVIAWARRSSNSILVDILRR